MDYRQLVQAAELAGALAENHYALPEGRDATAQATVALSMARLYVLRYARFLEAGSDSDEALKPRLVGDTLFPPRDRKYLHLIKPPGEA